MRGIKTFAALVLSGGLAACTAAAPPLQPVPLVAVPGPTKTEAEFRQDDTACRAAAVVLPANPSTPSTRPAAPSTPTAAPSNGQATNPVAGQAQDSAPPGLVYLRCMEARQNVVQPLAPAQPVLYGYYAPYPIYDSYPFYYGGYPFFYGGFGVGFFSGGYGRHYGGFHHHGFHGGGFHGGGFGHGGFHR